MARSGREIRGRSVKVEKTHAAQKADDEKAEGEKVEVKATMASMFVKAGDAQQQPAADEQKTEEKSEEASTQP